MKVYLVELDNGLSFEDYYSWIEKAFTTYRGASQWLIDEGFEPHLEHDIYGDLELSFSTENNDAKIIEIEVSE